LRHPEVCIFPKYFEGTFKYPQVWPRGIQNSVARWFFQTKNPNLGKKIRGHRLENADIFYGHLKYFMNVWDIL
jgi:hypothetical protein